MHDCYLTTLCIMHGLWLRIINSKKRRKLTYTPLYVYKREKTHRRYRAYTLRINSEELKKEFKSKDELEKRHTKISQIILFGKDSVYIIIL